MNRKVSYVNHHSVDTNLTEELIAMAVKIMKLIDDLFSRTDAYNGRHGEDKQRESAWLDCITRILRSDRNSDTR